MYSKHNEKKSAVAERFIRTLKNKIYNKNMTSISKNVYIDQLDGKVKKYNNTYHSTVKMKLVDVNSSTYINYSKEINNKDPKFKIVDIIRISKHKNIFQKTIFPVGLKFYYAGLFFVFLEHNYSFIIKTYNICQVK